MWRPVDSFRSWETDWLREIPCAITIVGFRNDFCYIDFLIKYFFIAK